jgi:hypothetical protein
MDKVPFDSLGPGQSGRLVYQVLGKDGPIPNPSNIRYLAPDSPEAAGLLSGPLGPAGSQAVGLGLAGASLMCSVGTLAVSLHTSKRIAELHDKTNALLDLAADIKDTVDEILRTAKRIDVKVAENNLRHALNQILRECVSPEGVSLSSLIPLKGDLDNFVDSLDVPLCFNFSIRLSSDVRKSLGMVCGLLAEARKYSALHHNKRVHGDPERCALFRPRRDYFFNQGLSDIVKNAILHDTLTASMSLATEEVAASVKDRFFMAGDHDQGHYRDLITEKLIAPVNSAFLERDVFAYCASMYLPQELFGEGDKDAVFENVYDVCEAWLEASDGGLVHKTIVELVALAEGYENTVWHHLIDIDADEDVPFQAVSEFALVDHG